MQKTIVKTGKADAAHVVIKPGLDAREIIEMPFTVRQAVIQQTPEGGQMIFARAGTFDQGHALPPKYGFAIEDPSGCVGEQQLMAGIHRIFEAAYDEEDIALIIKALEFIAQTLKDAYRNSEGRIQA